MSEYREKAEVDKEPQDQKCEAHSGADLTKSLLQRDPDPPQGTTDTSCFLLTFVSLAEGSMSIRIKMKKKIPQNWLNR